MSTVIEFYVPARFRKRTAAVPREAGGQVLPFRCGLKSSARLWRNRQLKKLSQPRNILGGFLDFSRGKSHTYESDRQMTV